MTVNIVSFRNSNVFLRMDGSKVNRPEPDGAGTVNCQWSAGPWEQFNQVSGENDTRVAFQSVAFPNAWLRMDGTGVNGHEPDGAGTVNCQYYPTDETPVSTGYEWFNLVSDPNGRNCVFIESVAFPGVYLRMDITGCTHPVGSGCGVVNCQGDITANEAVVVTQVS